MTHCINDDKSVYIREDRAYKTICYTNLGVIEADEFRKNLGVKNDQLVRIERHINDSHNNENICKGKYGKTVPNSWTTL